MLVSFAVSIRRAWTAEPTVLAYHFAQRAILDAIPQYSGAHLSATGCEGGQRQLPALWRTAKHTPRTVANPGERLGSEPNRATVRLLLIEDEEPLAAALAQGLRHHGYAVDVAPDGEQGMLWRRAIPITCSSLISTCPGWMAWRSAAGYGAANPACSS